MNLKNYYWLVAVAAVATSLAIFPGCQSTPAAGTGNTNWHLSCSDDDECGAELMCVCGICQRACAGVRSCARDVGSQCVPADAGAESFDAAAPLDLLTDGGIALGASEEDLFGTPEFRRKETSTSACYSSPAESNTRPAADLVGCWWRSESEAPSPLPEEGHSYMWVFDDGRFLVRHYGGDFLSSATGLWEPAGGGLAFVPSPGFCTLVGSFWHEHGCARLEPVGEAEVSTSSSYRPSSRLEWARDSECLECEGDYCESVPQSPSECSLNEIVPNKVESISAARLSPPSDDLPLVLGLSLTFVVGQAIPPVDNMDFYFDLRSSLQLKIQDMSGKTLLSFPDGDDGQWYAHRTRDTKSFDLHVTAPASLEEGAELQVEYSVIAGKYLLEKPLASSRLELGR